jgi:hypothetical protein
MPRGELLGSLEHITGNNAPLWYQVTLLTVGPVAALTGGTLAGGEARWGVS